MRLPTARQLEVLGRIADHLQSRGYVPTSRELMADFGWTSSMAFYDCMSRLEKKGLVDLGRSGRHTKSRAYRITETGWAALNREPTARVEMLVRITGYCDPPSARCHRCGRVFFRGAETGHECRADDVACMLGAA